MPAEQPKTPLSLEELLVKIRRHWVEATTYTAVEAEKFSIHVSEVPPIIAPSLRAPEVVNTEMEKNSTFLKEGRSKVDGKGCKMAYVYGRVENCF